jgi:hypothetical protein
MTVQIGLGFQLSSLMAVCVYMSSFILAGPAGIQPGTFDIISLQHTYNFLIDKISIFL